MPDIRDEAIRCRLVADIGGTTIWRWRSDDAVRPWAHRSPVFPRDPDFPAKADRVLDLHQRTHNPRVVQGEGLRPGALPLPPCPHPRPTARPPPAPSVRPPRPNEQTAKPLEWKLTRSDLDQLLKRLAGNPTSSRRLAQTRDRAFGPEFLASAYRRYARRPRASRAGSFSSDH
ncbi:MAG: hypothetical protein ACRDZ4_05530 [Egibacteraceae bacterium]